MNKICPKCDEILDYKIDKKDNLIYYICYNCNYNFFEKLNNNNFKYNKRNKYETIRN
jgi:UDP-N-acetylmuramyl tripeptide synthase